MREFKINRNNIRDIEAWCIRFISPRQYYLHTQIGGHGWSIKQPGSSNSRVIIEDDKVALMAMIKFGE